MMITNSSLTCGWCGVSLGNATSVRYLNGNMPVCDLCLIKATSVRVEPTEETEKLLNRLIEVDRMRSKSMHVLETMQYNKEFADIRIKLFNSLIEERKNCIEVGHGHGCDMCASGRTDLCRYTNTISAMNEIDKLRERIAVLTTPKLNDKNWQEWKIDVTTGPPYAFIPYVDGELFEAYCVRGDRSPGRLIGIVHSGGMTKVQEFIDAHPEWEKEFSFANYVMTAEQNHPKEDGEYWLITKAFVTNGPLHQIVRIGNLSHLLVSDIIGHWEPIKNVLTIPEE